MQGQMVRAERPSKSIAGEVERLENIASRARDIANHAESVLDTFFGGEPANVGVSSSAAVPMAPGLYGRLDSVNQILDETLGRIQRVLNRME